MSQAWDPYADNLSNEIEKIQRRAAHFATSDYQNYELGCVTKLFGGSWLEVTKEQEKSRKTVYSKRDSIKTPPCPLMIYQLKSKLVKKTTTHAQQIVYHNLCTHKHFLSSVLCQERLKIGIVYYVVLWKL